MPIVSGDIDYYYSIKTAGAGDTTAQGDPDESLGTNISTTQIPDATLHALFDIVTGDENAASDIEYRCIFVRNNHGSLTLQGAVVWVVSQVAGGTSIAIGLDTTAISDADDTADQALTVANESTAPAGVTFSTPTTKGTGLVIGDLDPDEVKAIWIRRTAANTSALNNDGATLRVEGDTAE